MKYLDQSLRRFAKIRLMTRCSQRVGFPELKNYSRIGSVNE
jgi:hypothetical protein